MTEDLLILGELIAEQAAHMDAAEHRLLTNIRDFDAREGWASAMSCAHWLAWRVGWTLGTAREHVRVAKALGTLPHIDEALRLGKVSYCKVRAMTRVATPLNEQVLLMDALLSTGSQLEKMCRKYKQLRRYADGANPDDDDVQRCVSRRDLDNGMVRITAVLPPEEAALVWAALDQATKELLADERASAADGDNSTSRMPSTNVSAETSTMAAGKPSDAALHSPTDQRPPSGVAAEMSSLATCKSPIDSAMRPANIERPSSDVSAETSIATSCEWSNDAMTSAASDERRSASVSAETSTATTGKPSNNPSIDSATHSANNERRSSDVSAETSSTTSCKSSNDAVAPAASDERRSASVSAETSTVTTGNPSNAAATRVAKAERRSPNVSAETLTSIDASWAPLHRDGSSTASKYITVDDSNDDTNDDEYVRECREDRSFYDAVFGEADDDQSLRSRQIGHFDDDASGDEDEPIDDAGECHPAHCDAVGASAMPANRHGSSATAAAAPRSARQVNAQANSERSPTSEPKRKPRFNRADGLVALARRFACGDSSRTPFEIVVTVPAAALQQTASPDESVAFLGDGGCITAETARRLACDAGIVHMVEDEHGKPLTVGRRTRSIPTSIRRALLHRDKTCRFPGCTNRVYLDGHHIEHWANGGETALSNLVCVCGHHHKFVHEYNYRVELDAAGTPCFFDDRGRPVLDVPMRYAREDLGWEHIQAANRELEIAPHVCGWNGEPVQYADVCRALYRLDEGTLKPEDIC